MPKPNEPTIFGCRWCSHIPGPPKGGVTGLSANYEPCTKCKATSVATIGFTEPGGREVRIWHNPDNSLFIEFQQTSGKASRYTLSEELLLKAGVLKLSDTAFNGRKLS